MAEKEQSGGWKQVEQFASDLSLKQRFMVLGGALTIVATLWFFVKIVAAPDMKTLYSGLKPADAQTIAEKLAAKGIRYEVSGDGVQVPAEQLDRARMETASQGLPKNARLGFELFDSPNWMGTDFTEKVNFQRALEGELERTIQSMGEVEAARVHLVMPAESLFTEREREGKAAVILKTRRQLSAEKQFGIAQLVASSVDNMRPENVTVMDADSTRPMQKPEEASGAGTLSEHLSRQIVETLEPVVGEGHVRATVRVEYDSSSFEDTQEMYDPKSAVATSMQKMEENSGGSAIGGIPGTASNVPPVQKPAVTSGAGERASARSESSTFAISKQVRHTVQPAGRLRRLTAAVLVDDAMVPGAKGEERRKRTSEEMKELETLASAAIGVDPQRGDVIAVENLSFRDAAKETFTPPGLPEKVRVQANRWSFLLRYAAIALLFLVVYLIILRPVKKQILTAFRELPQRISANIAAGAEGKAEVLPAESGMSGLRKQLVDKVKGEPVTATKLVQSWIREGTS